MHILVTAGNTQAPIDRVRCITNVFTGRTGGLIATHAQMARHAVTVMNSITGVAVVKPFNGLTVLGYRTFDELRRLMADRIPGGSFDAIIHCAAVSDYLPAGIFAADRATPIENAGKLKSDAPEVWLRLVRAPKLVDMIRREWGFRGVLVKFKLEAGVDDEKLLSIAESSRMQSDADLMVANTLEGMADWAFLGPLAGRYERIARPDLPTRLLEAITAIHEGR